MNDRHKQALDMRNNGKTLREIGAFFGVSLERARQMISIAKREAGDRRGHEFDVLGARIKNALLFEGITDKTEVVAWLSASCPAKVERIGGLSLNIIREWAGVFEKEMKVENCGNCKYWGGVEDDDEVQRCRRYPPKPWMSECTEDEVVEPGTYDWPYTMIDRWCGEYKAANA